MRLVRHVVSSLLVLSVQVDSALASGDAAPASPVPLTQPCASAATLLELRGIPREARHGGKQGEAHFVLKARSNGAVLWKAGMPGEGICFGFDAGRRAYVVGIRKEHGIGIRLTSIFYVDEVRHLQRESAFNRRGIEAFAVVPGPDLHHLALLAIERNETHLFVLDVRKDTLRRLGRAPAPPPLTPQERRFVQEHPGTVEGPWEWMASLRDSYMDLDPGIVAFDGNARLRASYGVDSATRRSPQRDVVTWDLSRPVAAPARPLRSP